MSEFRKPEEHAESDFKRLVSALEFPNREEVENMDFRELHELWRKNHRTFMEALRCLDLSRFPCLATHGAQSNGIDYLEGHSIPVSVLLNSRRPESVEEAASMLYGLSASAISHGLGSRGEKDGGFIVVNLGIDFERAKSIMNMPRSTNITMNYLLPMETYPVPFNSNQELSKENWRMVPADEVFESRIFSSIRQMENTGDITANEIDSRILDSLSGVFRVDLKKCPGYQNLKPQNEIIDGYRKSIALRLESLFASKAILEKFL